MNAVLLFLAWRASRNRTSGIRWKGVARVGSYGLLATAALTGTAVTAAKAEVGGSALQMGRELSAVAEEATSGTTAVLNGQRFHLSDSTTAKPVVEVLDGIEKACRDNPGGLAPLFEAMPKNGQVEGKSYTLPESFSHGVVRNGSEKDGVVMCFVGDGNTRKNSLEALADFAKSQDLGDLGKLRYVYAKREKSGKTRVTLAWTDEHFSLKAVTAGGEEHGKDGIVPRPSGAHRLMTAEIQGVSQSTTVFETAMKAEAVVSYYDETLAKAGFVKMTPQTEGQTLRAYFREGTDVFLAVRTVDGKTGFAVTENKALSPKFKNVLEVVR
jgi:hypothetical protein